MAEIERVYWDSMTFNYRIAEKPEHIDIHRHVSDRAEHGEIEIATSAFTLCEVAKVEPATSTLSEEEQERLIVRFFENPFIILVQVDRRVGVLARDIVRRYGGIKGKDGIHIASAIISRSTVLHTYDEAMLKKNGLIGDPQLRIERPNWKDGQPPLPTNGS
jgi:predicted nucleic acid-binding protein